MALGAKQLYEPCDEAAALSYVLTVIGCLTFLGGGAQDSCGFHVALDGTWAIQTLPYKELSEFGFHELELPFIQGAIQNHPV